MFVVVCGLLLNRNKIPIITGVYIQVDLLWYKVYLFFRDDNIFISFKFYREHVYKTATGYI